MKFLPVLLALAVASVFGQAVAAPPVLGNVRAGDSSCRMEWAATPSASGYNIYLKNGAAGYRKLNAKPVTDTFVRLVDLINGTPYFFAVTAIEAGGGESSASVAPMVVPKGYGYKTVRVKGGSSAKDYSLFSTPYLNETSGPKDFFSYLPQYALNRWRVFSMDKDGYHEFDSIKNIEPGKGYWFLSASDTELFLSGKTVDNDKPFYVRLQPGWNLIGAPFLYPVEWKEVLAHNRLKEGDVGSAVWEYSPDGFRKMGTILPCHGYLVFNASGDDLDLLIPPVPAEPKVYQEAPPPGTEASADGRAGGWLMKLSADDGTYRDDDNYFGVETRETSDGMESHEPPAWPQHLSLYFQRKSENGARRSADIRHSTKKWLAVVEGGQNSIVTLRWKTVAGKSRATMTDMGNNRRVDMAKTGAYSFTRDGTAPRKFIINERP